jgi:hypothetical protein
MVTKVIRDGKVAVLYSPGFGAGWSTWNSQNQDLLFDSIIVDFVLNKPENWVQAIEAYCSIAYTNLYDGGVSDLEVVWIPVGSQFLVEEYDGSESVVLKDEMNWIVA